MSSLDHEHSFRTRCRRARFTPMSRHSKRKCACSESGQLLTHAAQQWALSFDLATPRRPHTGPATHGFRSERRSWPKSSGVTMQENMGSYWPRRPFPINVAGVKGAIPPHREAFSAEPAITSVSTPDHASRAGRSRFWCHQWSSIEGVEGFREDDARAGRVPGNTEGHLQLRHLFAFRAAECVQGS
jgi:hypothetical protein